MSQTSQVFTELTSIDGNNAILGYACFFNMVIITQYNDYLPGYSILNKTMSNVGLKLVRSVVGIMHIWIAFVFLEFMFFNTSNECKDSGYCSQSMFALIYGDSPQSYYREFSEINIWWANLYLYIWSFLGYVVFQNLWTALIEDGFLQFQNVEKYDFLNTFQNKAEEIIDNEEVDDVG